MTETTFTPSPSAKDVFVSYASQDAVVANAIVETLEGQGIRCWIAPRDVTPGAHYADEIIGAIGGAKALILVLSDSALASKHVSKEVERASSKGRPIIALRLGKAPLTPALEYFLSESQWIDAPDGHVAPALPKLLTAIQRLSHPSGATKPGAPEHMREDAPGPSILRIGAKSPRVSGRKIAVLALITAAALAYYAAPKIWPSKRAIPATVSAAATPNVAISAKSIAVLPFVDMSEKHDQEYLSDGLSEELIDMLAKVPDLRVPARTSSFYFKGRPDDISTIASRLKVAHVLEGSVRKSGTNLRITVELIRADNGYHLWSQTYDRKLDDIFKVQDDIAAAVVGTLKVSLLGAEPPRATPTKSSEAYALYLQARSIYRNANTHEDDERAFTLLRKVLTLDPGFAPAWATLAGDRCDDAIYYEIELDAQARKEIRDTAAQAVGLNPKSSDAHYAMGICLSLVDWDWKAGEAELRRALELEPLNSDAIVTLANLLYIVDTHSPEALLLAKRAVDRDPLYAYNYNILSVVLYVNGNYAEADQAARKAVDLSPTADGLHYALAYLLLNRGQAATALKELEREPNETFRESLRPQILYALGRAKEADRALTAFEANYGNVDPYGIAMVYGRRNDADRAFIWLERAYQQHNLQLPSVRSATDFASLRSDPRFKVLLKKLNLPE